MAYNEFRKRSRNEASSSQPRSQSPPDIGGVRFSDYGQRDRFMALRERLCNEPRLIKESQKTDREIHGGGLVTLIARLPHIRVTHTMERLEDGNTLTGETLALADPANNTNWREEEEREANEEAPPQQQQQGWGDYGALQEQIDYLQEDVVQIDDNVHALRVDFDDYVSAQQRHNLEMERMMQHVYQWTLGHPHHL
ncbi:hypothetical protein L1887_18869 [Cichorium endivia]|nr:hypothetical protein L1887_18869 [Cichorium endivia]